MKLKRKSSTINQIYIYGLYTNKYNIIRYVGKTFNIKKRLKAHVKNYAKSHTHKNKWIAKHIKNGETIKIRIIEITNKKEWKKREIYWIKKLKKNNLTNSTKGGENGAPSKYKKTYKQIKKWVKINLPFIKRNTQWDEYIKSNLLPDFIPKYPNGVYKNRGWISWGDFLGTGRISNQNKSKLYVSYNKAKIWIKKNIPNIKNRDEWQKNVKNNKIPIFIPIYPETYYRNKGWVSEGDFLGNKTISNFHKNKIFLSYKNAKQFIGKIKYKPKTMSEWKKFTKQIEFPIFLPIQPNKTYKNKGWISWGVFLGTGKIQDNKKANYISYEEAKIWIKNNIGILKSATRWKELVQKNKIPYFIPNHPELYYNRKDRGWEGWGFFLQNGVVATNYNRFFLSFEEARKYVRNLKIKSCIEWRSFYKNKNFPTNIPKAPNNTYKEEWISWGDWLGTGTIASNKIIYWSFAKSKQYIYNLKIKNYKEWLLYCKSGKKPNEIPTKASSTYKSSWIDWYDWLGKERKK